VTKKRGNKCGKMGGEITNYLNHLSPKIDILCLQEYKLRGDILDRISKMLWRLDAFWSLEATPSIDTDDIKIGAWRGGVALYFHTKVRSLIIDEGTLVGNRVQWIRLKGRKGGDVVILNLYVSNMASERSAI